MVATQAMGLSVRILRDTLKELDAANKPYTFEEIAQRIGISVRTVSRGVKHLEQEKKLRRIATPRGFYFEVIADDQ